MTVTASPVVAEDEGPLRDPESLVARLHDEFGVQPDQIRRLAAEVIGTFSTARVQAFIPILVEKRLRDICRGPWPAAGPRRS